MSRSGAIGIVGATGDVGAHVVKVLRGWGIGRLRLGGRNVSAAAKSDDLGPDVEHQTVDFLDDGSLARFVDGCRIVVNCAGPSSLVADRVVRAARRVGADYVDSAGDDALHGVLDPADFTAHTAVLSAGLRPGLTALLPLWAARQEFDSVVGLEAYCGVRDLFTRVAAADYLHGSEDQTAQPLAAWRNGRRPRVLTRRTEMSLPYFPAEVTALPILSTESERLAQTLGLASGDWYAVVSGEHVGAAFDRVRTLDREDAIATLCRASRLDLAGRDPHVVLLTQLDGMAGGERRTRTVVLRGNGNGAVTGAMTALTVLAVDRREVPAGRHYAAEVLDPAVTLSRLTETGAANVSVLDAGINELTVVEEGAL